MPYSKSASRTGIYHESETGEYLIGQVLNDQDIQVHYSLPKELWDRNEAWNYANAIQLALSLCLGVCRS